MDIKCGHDQASPIKITNSNGTVIRYANTVVLPQLDNALSGGDDGIITIDTIRQIETVNMTNVRLTSNANYPVNVNTAAIGSDATNAAIQVVRLDADTKEGVAFDLATKEGANNLTIIYRGRAQTAPVSSVAAVLGIYFRIIPINAAVGAWSAGYTTILNLPAGNTFYQESSVTVSYSSLGLLPGRYYTVAVYREAANPSDTLTVDLSLTGITFIHSL